MHASTWSWIHKDIVKPGGVVRSMGLGVSKVWMSVVKGVGKTGFLEAVSEGTIVLVGGVGTLRVVLVFGPDWMSSNTGGEELLVADAEWRVAMRIGVRGDRSGLGTGLTSAGGGVLPVEGGRVDAA